MGELGSDSNNKWQQINEGDTEPILQGQLDPGVIIVSTRIGSDQPVSRLRIEGTDLAAIVEGASGEQQSADVVVEGADCPSLHRDGTMTQWQSSLATRELRARR